MIGIYKIQNIINNKCYYGSSKNIETRFGQHKYVLNNKKHINIILQRAWNKYGESNFIFECVEECNIDELFVVEQKYLNLLPAYNIGINASGGDNLSKNPNRLVIIDKIKNTMNNKIQNMTDEEKKNLYSKPNKLNPNWKGGISKKICKCGNKMNYYSTVCINCDDRTGENNSFYGKHHSHETKKKLSLIHKGKEQNHSNKIFFIDNVEYRTLKEASDKLNIPIPTIQHRLNSKNFKYINYYYKGIDKISYSYDEQKYNQRNRSKGKEQNHSNKIFFIDNVEYRTLKEASNKLNIPIPTICDRLKNKNYKNYKYKINYGTNNNR